MYSKFNDLECCKDIGDDSLFYKEDNEIILCLNYDGPYGINNINKIMQLKNPNIGYKYRQFIYKIGDPIIFNDFNLYKPALFNNLSGKIINIQQTNQANITFILEVNRLITDDEALRVPITIISRLQKSTIIMLGIQNVNNYGDEDDDEKGYVPFQVSYALGIHKAQGLEYDTVKVIISKEVEELITHNIFYTAITRARKKLLIYWSPESQKKIIDNFKDPFNAKDYSILKNKFYKDLN